MKFIIHYAFIIFYLAIRESVVYSALTDTLISIFDSSYKTESPKLENEDKISLRMNVLRDDDTDNEKTQTTERRRKKKRNRKKIQTNIGKLFAGEMMRHRPDGDVFNDLTETEKKSDVLQAKNKSTLLRMLKTMERESNGYPPASNKNLNTSDASVTNFYHIDPVFNLLEGNPKRKSMRRKGDSDSISSSSSREMKDFKTEFNEMWLHKKFEALNNTIPRGDQVNMIAARPWGVSCGDPNQHDMPWGTCMLSIECEPEFRIYRGDYFCGRTQFVCCALQLTNYDMYQGFDVSFDDKSLGTDSDEQKDKKTSRERKKRNKAKERKKRQKARKHRKKKIKHHIKKIVKEIRKILNRQYRNGTRQRKRRTKQLKKFIKDLKQQYKKDRQSVKDLHEEEMIKIDNTLLTRLFQIKYVNDDFVKNATFREILINGTISKKGARMLVEAYPELNEFLETRREGDTIAGRRRGTDDYLEYDIEYGYLYY